MVKLVDDFVMLNEGKHLKLLVFEIPHCVWNDKWKEPHSVNSSKTKDTASPSLRRGGDSTIIGVVMG
ncbi:MAG: hypothetical protein ICV66_01380 [Chitinophagaceae bacterium]|nr:hypothetical protein [Chitinophagaceae bacterium]